MKLQELLSKGAFIDDGYEERAVTWDNGAEVLEFKVQAKKEWSSADFEFVFIQSATETSAEDKSYFSRVVHRLIRLDGEPIDIKNAERLKFSLLMALYSVAPKPPPAAAEKN